MVPALVVSAVQWVGDKKVAARMQCAKCQEVGVQGTVRKWEHREGPLILSLGVSQRGLPGGRDT